MRLETRLTLASLANILLFLVCFGIAWMMFGGRQLLGKPRFGMAERFQGQVRRVYSEGGWKGLEQGLRWSMLPPDASVSVIELGKEPKLLQGRSRPVDPKLVDRAFRGEVAESFGSHGLDICIPVVNGPKVEGIVLLTMFASLHHGEFRWQVVFSLLAGILVASTAAGVAGAWGSRAVSRPFRRLVDATEALSRQDFQHRIPAQGPAEFQQLAESFNRMADNLQQTVDSLVQAKEVAERSEASRRQFLADVSHNLRTPLTAVLGWTEALIDGLTPGEEKVQLANIRQQTLYVSLNVQRLLDWSRWEDRPPQLSSESFAISEPLMDVVQTLEEQAQRANIQLELLGLEDEMWVRGDRTRVREILQLLLENAVQHNPSGTKIAVAFAKENSGRLRVTVSDDGVGLPVELNHDLQCRVGGGLGLAIAVRLVAAHGGKLEIRHSSLSGQECRPGTSLSFTLESSSPQPSGQPEFKSLPM